MDPRSPDAPAERSKKGAAGGTTTFGFLVNGGAPSAAVGYSCMVM